MYRILALLSFVVTVSAEPVAVDDAALEDAFTKGMIAFSKDGKEPTADALSASLKKAPKRMANALPEAAENKNPEYSVFVIATVYKGLLGKKLHFGGGASAWALSEDGIMVTNYHVMEAAEGAAVGVCDKKGNVYRVLEILAAIRKAT